MSALSTHHKRTKRSETRKEQRSTNKWRKTQKGKNSHLLKQNRSLKTRATARRNRSKAKTWLLKDRDNARRSHARSRGKTRKSGATNKAETPPKMHFPNQEHKQSRNSSSLSQMQLSQMMHSQSPVHNKFFKNQTSLHLVRSLLPKILPLVGTCTHQA